MNKKIKSDKIVGNLIFYRNVVIDNINGLMWTINANIFRSKLSWRQAEKRINKLNYGGYNDWRLPTGEELLEFIETADSRNSDPSIMLDNIGFYDVMASNYWVKNNNKYNHFNMIFGKIRCYESQACFVWPVRDYKTNKQKNLQDETKIEFDRQLKEKYERIAAIKRKEEELIRLHEDTTRKEEERVRLIQETKRIEKEKSRNDCLQEIRRQLHVDFLNADSFFRNKCSDFVISKDYKLEKISFVTTWASEYNQGGKNIKHNLPDGEQAFAIASVNGNIHVVARAGSGKTTTLVNRALFLMKHCGVAPSEMLLLAFNRKAALEIRRRLLNFLNPDAEAAVAAEVDRRIRERGIQKKINRDEIEANSVAEVAKRLNITPPHVMTFHALAYAIVHPEESPLHDGPEGESQEMSRVFQQVIDDNLQETTFKEQVRELMLGHFRGDWERITGGGYDKGKTELLRFRRSLPRQSLGGEPVKSFGEKVIADFLFEHDIAYKYERNHWWSGINYRPDFTIFKNDIRGQESGVIIEYFGLNGETDYDEMTEEKRKYWKAKQRWTLIEFSPRDIVVNGVDSFLTFLKQRLIEQGVHCVPLTEDEIWHRLKDRAIDRFTKATGGFISRCRNQLMSPSDLRSLIDKNASFSPSEEKFLNVAHQLYVAYLDRLCSTGEDDFNGLMQRAADRIESGMTLFERKSGRGDLKMLRYVCIDEFQDFSELFYRLLNSIRKQNPRIELFCVGDDWQAINGFSGSDLKFFQRFNEYIGHSRQLNISTNYRSSKSVVEIGNVLMNGRGKPAVAHKVTPRKVLLTDLNTFEPNSIEREQHPGDIITPAVLRLTSKALNEDLDVVILCRRNKIPWFVNDHNGQSLGRYLDIVRSFFPKGLKERITISTAHKYKGLEKSMVIILDADLRSYPLIHPTWEFFRVLGDSPEKIIEEERRLFYVALTRAVEKLVIITDGRSKSPFLEEMERRHKFDSINWSEYPPIRRAITRLVVKVGNHEQRGGEPTFIIKDLLKASQYKYQQQGKDGAEWVKSFLAKGFSIETLQAELWAASADGVVVRIYDDTEVLIARYHINSGQWSCVYFDQKQTSCTNE